MNQIFQQWLNLKNVNYLIEKYIEWIDKEA